MAKVHAILYVKEGRNLPAKDSNGLSDPYCKIYVGKHKPVKSTVCKKTLSPKWEPPIEVPFEFVPGEESEGYVKIEVYDKDTLKDDHMGVVYVHLPHKVDEPIYTDLWLPLELKHGKTEGEMFVGLRMQREAFNVLEGLPTVCADSSMDQTIISRLTQETQPRLFFTVVPRVLIVMRRKAQAARERVADGTAQKPTLGKSTSLGSRENDISEQKRQLADRLKLLGMEQIAMEDDGNCQFRSFSHQLYGTQDYHGALRKLCCQHMEAHSDGFEFYFESKNEWVDYLRKMKMNRTWGDELTLKAMCDMMGTEVHVVTSTLQNWYLKYTPESFRVEVDKKIFIAYISPIHYNSLACLPTAGSGIALGKTLTL
eukprot:comp20370_c0_seq1/m.25738 comp20370_c0_seq1/g.25738  ORF comp20370_c0_seq1/g.25738 comp20370_c0_seq1/m.25738 type:complete len:369 (-) comp20370_c0_seq1:414-1520(-)